MNSNKETLRGYEQLTAANHTLYLRVQHLVRLEWRWEAIAADIGLVGPSAVIDLCEWVLAYREPKKLPMVNSGYVNDVPVRPDPIARNTQQFIAWKRQRDGARKAREAAGL